MSLLFSLMNRIVKSVIFYPIFRSQLSSRFSLSLFTPTKTHSISSFKGRLSLSLIFEEPANLTITNNRQYISAGFPLQFNNKKNRKHKNSFIRRKSSFEQSVSAMDVSVTKLDYFDDMSKLHSNTTLLSFIKGEEDGRDALILESTIFYPQGGGQPADTGFIQFADSDCKFVVQDVRSKHGIVFHYGFVENPNGELETKLEKGKEALLYVDESRRKLNSRLHSAGHLIDACLQKVGLGHLEPTKGYHFPDGPFVEYKGTVPQNEMQGKQKDIELEANALISEGGKVSVAILPYEEASEQCGGSLPDYIPKGSTPRIVKLGNSPGGPCGGTHVSDISEIGILKVSQIRSKKGMTKVFYNVGS